MTIAVVVFPGTNCERDVQSALESLGAPAELVFHRETNLDRYSGVVLPGGFAHGDYLRTGAIARFSPVMAAVARMAGAGRPVLGICNGFQILCEAGLLPGALVANDGLAFICRMVTVVVDSTDTALTRAARTGQVLRIPLNSYQGNYQIDPEELAGIEGRIALRYCAPSGEVGPAGNPNGSSANVAAVAGNDGNVVGVMPHPERATDALLGSTDGRVLLESFVASASMAHV